MNKIFLDKIIKAIGKIPFKIYSETLGVHFLYFENDIIIGLEEECGTVNVWIEDYGKYFDDISDSASKLSETVDDTYLIEGLTDEFKNNIGEDVSIYIENIFWFINSVRKIVRKKSWYDKQNYPNYTAYDFKGCYDVFLPENKKNKKRKRKKQ